MLSFLNDIVAKINKELLPVAIGSSQYQKGMYYGICTPAAKSKDEVVPAYRINKSKDLTYIGPDDKYPIVVYHKLLSKAYAVADGNAGDDDNWIKQTANMQLVVYAKSSALNYVTEEQLESVMSMAITAELRHLDNVQSAFVQAVSSDFDKQKLFTSEFKGVKPFLGNDHLFFSINYNTECTFDKKCLKLCFDCD